MFIMAKTRLNSSKELYWNATRGYRGNVRVGGVLPQSNHPFKSLIHMSEMDKKTTFDSYDLTNDQ